MAQPRLLVPLARIRADDVETVGGKNASLGEMMRHLSGVGVKVPDGFALTAQAFRLHLAQAGLDDYIAMALAGLDIHDVTRLRGVAADIRERVRSAPLPYAIQRELAEAYAHLSHPLGRDADVAVRSSATAEDLPNASFAGQHETFLNVTGMDRLEDAVRACMASLYTDRAIVYRVENGFRHEQVALSVGVQQMVRSDVGSAGVIFTLDTETGFRDVVLLTGAWGLAETVVQGRVRPDEYWIHKPTLQAGYRSIVRRSVGDKRVKLIYGESTSSRAVVEVAVEPDRQMASVLTDDEILTLARWAMAIESHYQRPMDIEWAKDGHTGELFIVQARPETVHARATTRQFDRYHLDALGPALITGTSVGAKIASGPVRRITSPADLATFETGEILVSRMTDPSWEPVLRRAAGVVTDEGGRTCHAAIVSREIGIPCVVGTGRATELLQDGQTVTISCAGGGTGVVYAGAIPFHRETIDLDQLAEPRVPLLLNVADPDQAFGLSMTPNSGVGLLRIEFVITHWIGVHPMALLHPEQVGAAGVRQAVLAKARGFTPPAEYFVDRLASGIAVIAAAFYPRPVIARFSDFKTHEYAGLLGGADFEADEENPMIGFRGAARYYDDRYREAFGLECQAVRRVRDTMGLSNVKVMVPFCRTTGEASRVLSVMREQGLRRGGNGLEVYVMAEIPSNAVLAPKFAELFDGFSIGSNDLTQLVLGADRDSSLLSHVFDERDPAVKAMISMVIAGAHSLNRPVGICGQAPSDYPEFAEWLADQGIDSLSLNPDSVVDVMRRLGPPALAMA